MFTLAFIEACLDNRNNMAEKLTFHNFQRKREQGSIALSLVGMSNVGKSYWSNRLHEESGFLTYGCDDEIEVQLENELRVQGYGGGIADVAHWMGQPYDPQFPAAQARYLELEADVTRQALDSLESGDKNRNFVLDTTGSVVHLDPSLRRSVKGQTTVVYLEATPEMQEEMFRRYMEHPKPVVWGDIYKSNENEDRLKSLSRLYPILLAHRSTLYDQMADVTITREDAESLRDSEDFLEHIRYSLR